MGLFGSLGPEARATFGIDAHLVNRPLDWIDGRIAALRAALAVGAPGDAQAGDALVAQVRQGLATTGPSPPPASPSPPRSCAARDRLAPGAALVGDSLSLRFFEREADDPASGRDAALPVFFERLDLSAAYDVDQAGEISIPLLGRVAAEGRSLACVEAFVTQRYAEVFVNPASVTAAVAARAPVLVAGDVRAPGSYQVNGPLTLRHLLALAGARSTAGRGVDPVSTQLSARRLELDRLLSGIGLEILALQAAQARRPALEVSASERSVFLVELGPLRLEAEQADLAARLDGHARQQEALAAAAGHAQSRLDLIVAERRTLARQVAEKTSQLAGLRNLTDRGLAPLNRLTADEAALVALERAAFAVEEDLLTARQALSLANAAVGALEADFTATLAAALRERSAAAAAIEAQVAAIDLQVRALHPDAEGPSEVERYAITRTTSDGAAHLAGDLASTILPGDLVEVTWIDTPAARIR